MSKTYIRASFIVFAVLTAGSVAGLVLPRLKPGADFTNLRQRVGSWWWMAGLTAADSTNCGSADALNTGAERVSSTDAAPMDASEPIDASLSAREISPAIDLRTA